LDFDKKGNKHEKVRPDRLPLCFDVHACRFAGARTGKIADSATAAESTRAQSVLDPLRAVRADFGKRSVDRRATIYVRLAQRRR